MRLYVIPLLAQELSKADREIALHKNKLQQVGNEMQETGQYLRDRIDYWQIIKQEILEAINKLELS